MNIEIIWQEYKSGLKLFISSKVDNHSDVEEILQEVLIKSFKNINSLKSEENIKSWLYQITRNAISDFYRARKKEVHQPLVEELDSLVENKEYKVEKQLSLCISPFINLLPGPEKELLKAIEIEGLSQKKYAEDHGIKYSTLKSRVKKGREMLRAKFEECCKFSFDAQGNLLDFDQKSGTCKKC